MRSVLYPSMQSVNDGLKHPSPFNAALSEENYEKIYNNAMHGESEVDVYTELGICKKKLLPIIAYYYDGGAKLRICHGNLARVDR